MFLTSLYDPAEYSPSEIAILKEHDRYENLHPYFANGDEYPTCEECGDDSSGLMHNNTWRNVEPLLCNGCGGGMDNDFDEGFCRDCIQMAIDDGDLDRCSTGCVCERDED